MVPGVFEWIIQGQWQEQKPKAQESGSVSVVNQRHRTCQETFRTSQVVFKDGKCLVHFILSHEMHGHVFNGHGKIIECTVGSVCSIDDGIGL